MINEFLINANTKLIKDEREEQKLAEWKRFISKTDVYRRQLRNTMGQLFEQEQNEVLAGLDTVKYYVPARLKGKESSFLPNLADMIQSWVSSFLPIIRDIVKREGSDTLDKLKIGGSLNLTTDEAIKYLDKNGLLLVKEINSTTREALRTTLAEGFTNGEGVEKLKDRVNDVFDIANNSRSRKIARTEAIRASNFGANEAYRQSGIVTGKEWLAERDDRTDEFCEELDGKIVDIDDSYLDIGDKFQAGGKVLNIDLFSVEYPPLHPNCRCTLIPVIVRD